MKALALGLLLTSTVAALGCSFEQEPVTSRRPSAASSKKKGTTSTNGTTGDEANATSTDPASGAPGTSPGQTSTRVGPTAPPKSEGTFTTKTVSYASGNAHDMKLWLPDGEGPFPVIVYIHGGAWLEGDFDEASPIAEREATRGYAVASLNYRLSSQAKFPAQIQDVKAGVRWLRAHAGEHRLDPERFATWGSSAGAHLAALLGASGGVAAFEDANLGNAGVSSGVRAVVDWYGPTDFRRMDAQTVDGCESQNHDGGDSPESLLVGCSIQEASCKSKVDAASPLSYVDAKDPPYLIMHGTNDCTVATGQSNLLDDALRAKGATSMLVLVDGLGHDFDGMRGDDERMNRLDAFLDRALYP